MGLSKIELKLIDDKGNYSIAHIDYKGYVDMLTNHKVSMLDDVMKVMVEDYNTKGKTEFTSDIKQ